MLITEDSLPEISTPKIDPNSEAISEEIPLPPEPQPQPPNEAGSNTRTDSYDWRGYLIEAASKTRKRRQIEDKAQTRFERLCRRFHIEVTN